MNIINSEKAMLLIIDIQEKLVNMLGGSAVKENAAKLAKAAGILNLPAVITEQYPKGLGFTIEEIKSALPNAKYMEKTCFSVFNEQESVHFLPDREQIIICGIETHICVLQSAFDLLNKGYEVFIVKNACGSRTEEDKQTAIQRLNQAKAQIVTAESVIFELLRSSNHPHFKEIQALIK